MNETYIYCPLCSGDMNSADWEANEGHCLHCGSSALPENPMRRQRRNPLSAVRRQLEIRSLLHSEPVTIYA